jgi:cation transport ATPase
MSRIGKLPIELKEGTEVRVDRGVVMVKGKLGELKVNVIIGVITIADIIREESKQAVKILQEQGIKVAMITGDSNGVAAYAARRGKWDRTC